jgi:2-polyprenyl-3-methyl-5-hydroxy-6-metoxy-1,4-benzoquinol methylase
MKDIASCPLCKTSEFNTLLDCTDYTVSHETFTIKECSNCKFAFTSPIPENIDHYYRSDSYISHGSIPTSIIDKIYVLVRHLTLEWKYRLITRYAKHTKSNSILDFGCGTGEFLKKCKAKKLPVYGVEPSEKARSQACENTQEQIASTLKELSHNSFDTITLWHVLEHVPNLQETLFALTQKLSNSGTMFIAVPNHRSNDAKYYTRYWAGYDVPRHLWHFSQSNMESLIQQHGLTLIAKVPMKLDAYYISLISEKNKNNNGFTIFNCIRGLYVALKSNLRANHSGEFSSIIYIMKK